MAQWASIVSGSVQELTSIDPAGRFFPGIVWVACPDSTQVGYLYDGSIFTAPPPAPQTVPLQVSIVQAELALLAIPSPTHTGMTLLDDVNTAVAAAAQPVRIAWARASAVERDGVFINQIAPNIPGLQTEEQRDALFVTASQIKT